MAPDCAPPPAPQLFLARPPRFHSPSLTVSGGQANGPGLFRERGLGRPLQQQQDEQSTGRRHGLQEGRAPFTPAVAQGERRGRERQGAQGWSAASRGQAEKTNPPTRPVHPLPTPKRREGDREGMSGRSCFKGANESSCLAPSRPATGGGVGARLGFPPAQGASEAGGRGSQTDAPHPHSAPLLFEGPFCTELSAPAWVPRIGEGGMGLGTLGF